MSLTSIRVKIIAVKYFFSIYFWGKLHHMSFETTKFLDAFLQECLSADLDTCIIVTVGQYMSCVRMSQFRLVGLQARANFVCRFYPSDIFTYCFMMGNEGDFCLPRLCIHSTPLFYTLVLFSFFFQPSSNKTLNCL